MDVTFGEPDKIISEMIDEVEIGYIAETISDPATLDSWCPGWSDKGRALVTATKDQDPDFVVMRVEEGWSNNKRLWDAGELRSIAEQTNTLEPVGHLGHIPDDQAGWSMPEPQTTWFGATTKIETSKQKDRSGEKVTVGYFAGYNMPGAKIRTLIPGRAVRGFSWWGSGEAIPIPGQGVQIKGFVLKALDWARKGSEGMPTARVVATVKEMENMDKALSQVTPDEFKKENPNGYALLVSEAVKDRDEKIGEMEAQVEEGDKAKEALDEIRKALKIDSGSDPLAAIAKLMTTLGAKAKDVVKAELDKLLAEKVPDETQRALVMRLLPVGEMEEKVSALKEDDDPAKTIGEMVTASFDNDVQVKSVIGEMQPPVVRRREALRATDDDLSGSGAKRERVTL